MRAFILSLLTLSCFIPANARAQTHGSVLQSYQFELWVRDPDLVRRWFLEITGPDGTRELGPYETEFDAEVRRFGLQEYGDLDPATRMRITSRIVEQPWVHFDTFNNWYEANELRMMFREVLGFDTRIATRRVAPYRYGSLSDRLQPWVGK